MNRNCLHTDLEGTWKRTAKDATCALRSLKLQGTYLMRYSQWRSYPSVVIGSYRTAESKSYTLLEMQL